jgi:hypothetical protein
MRFSNGKFVLRKVEKITPSKWQIPQAALADEKSPASVWTHRET